MSHLGIEPAIKPAATNSKTQTIGILATQGTLTSELFYETTKSLKHKKLSDKDMDLCSLLKTGNKFI
jgi:glutamate racemase